MDHQPLALIEVEAASQEIVSLWANQQALAAFKAKLESKFDASPYAAFIVPESDIKFLSPVASLMPSGSADWRGASDGQSPFTTVRSYLASEGLDVAAPLTSLSTRAALTMIN